MQGYDKNNSPSKLHRNVGFLAITNRNIIILNKLLNELGLADYYHECYLAIHLATDWSTVMGRYQALSVWRMAKKLALFNSESHKKVFERLRKKWPDFLRKLDRIGLKTIAVRRPDEPKQPLEYMYDETVIRSLWELPLSMKMAEIDKEVKKVVSKVVAEERVDEERPERKKERSSESIANSIAILLIKLRDSTSSIDEYQAELELAQERQGLPTIMHVTRRDK